MTGPGTLIRRLAAQMRAPDQPAGGFDQRPVGDDAIAALLGAARVAPSADNAQTWRFITITGAEKKAALKESVPEALRRDLDNAPLVAVACGMAGLFKSTKREQPFVLIDVPIAIAHILLQAAEIGLACSWTLECDESKVRSALSIPGDARVIAILCLGWPAV